MSMKDKFGPLAASDFRSSQRQGRHSNQETWGSQGRMEQAPRGTQAWRSAQNSGAPGSNQSTGGQVQGSVDKDYAKVGGADGLRAVHAAPSSPVDDLTLGLPGVLVAPYAVKPKRQVVISVLCGPRGHHLYAALERRAPEFGDSLGRNVTLCQLGDPRHSSPGVSEKFESLGIDFDPIDHEWKERYLKAYEDPSIALSYAEYGAAQEFGLDVGGFPVLLITFSGHQGCPWRISVPPALVSDEAGAHEVAELFLKELVVLADRGADEALVGELVRAFEVRLRACLKEVLDNRKENLSADDEVQNALGGLRPAPQRLAERVLSFWRENPDSKELTHRGLYLRMKEDSVSDRDLPSYGTFEKYMGQILNAIGKPRRQPRRPGVNPRSCVDTFGRQDPD